VSHDQEAGCGEEAFLAEDDRGGGAQRYFDSGVLPAAPVKGESVYWWQRKLKAGRQERTLRRQGIDRGAANFALVSDEPGATDAGLELVLGDGRRLRIRKGVDEETLRAVLAAVEPSRC